ncbi:ATP-binding cassette domain-containing protein [Urbifossiella limnaea]|uniref:Sulfate/thiosulfate import ATP-binding protein CysA n=1 Tax=Urbifossiella limnaea TaxID=2528023 RepID=A0A517XPS9_9BACT|nr:ABC transporter ATP-binding protein [Urbifossiella limnaea]QDU19496.1 Sulfate/thiosulfate import ATP-binding protein CysA [Urbifossiella limnaea]
MIELDAVTVRQGAFALDGVSLAVPPGAYAVLLGPSGAGKTTLLEVIAGLRRPRAGRVLLRGTDVTRLPAAARNVGYVPQDAALFRTMTVRENLGFALAVRGADPAARVAELAGWLGLGGLLDRRAVGLSGGEAQRVALGRALAFHPDVLLLDEPLNAVDEAARAALLDLLGGLRQQRRVTVLHVTHARAEADRLADVVLELDRGGVAVRESSAP